MAALGNALGLVFRAGRNVSQGLAQFENELINSDEVTLVNSRGQALKSGSTGAPAHFAASSSGRILINSSGVALLMPN